jgi:hypothetical protein
MNTNIKNVLKSNIIIIVMMVVFSQLICLTSCDNVAQIDPEIASTIDGVSVKEATFANGTEVTYNFKIKTAEKISRVEFYKISNGTSELVLRVLRSYGDIDSNEFEITGKVTVDKDIKLSLYVADIAENLKNEQVILFSEYNQFTDILLSDALADGTSKTFLNTSLGISHYLSAANVDRTSVDLGFNYLETVVGAKACFISMDEYSKVGIYPFSGTQNTTTFKLADNFTFSSKADIIAKYNSGAEFPVLSGYTQSKIAPNLNVGQCIALKTQSGNYALINIKAIDRKSEATNNTQTIRFDLVYVK